MSLLIKETQLQRIIRKTGRKPIQCNASYVSSNVIRLVWVLRKMF